ncbi:hypothetical protein ECCB7326_1188, partial [Escherichia coli CB7326]
MCGYYFDLFWYRNSVWLSLSQAVNQCQHSITAEYWWSR